MLGPCQGLLPHVSLLLESKIVQLHSLNYFVNYRLLGLTKREYTCRKVQRSQKKSVVVIADFLKHLANLWYIWC
jgi:hypothetical protein